jgi:hypothetical protein
MNCKSCQDELAEFLFDPAATAKPELEAHLAGCVGCSEEYVELRRTMSLMDAWEAPEPSAYFDQKMAVLLREEQAKAPAGWLERVREYLLFQTGRQFRPALVGALALVMVLGLGSFAGFTVSQHSGVEVQASAAVDDLQILDRNDQAIQQMDQLLQDDGEPDQGTAAEPAS